MSKDISPTQEAALRGRLQREACDDRPEFSEMLHRRIIAAVQQHEAPRPRSIGTSVARWQGWLVAVFTAACLLCAVAIGWRMTQRQSVPDTDVAAVDVETSLAGLPLPGELAGRGMDSLNGALISAALPQQSTDFAHDTRVAAESMLDRLPLGVEVLASP